MSISLKQRLVAAFQAFRLGRATPPTRSDIPALTDEEASQARKFFPMLKFFIFGHARSGTTLLARLVRLHPEVHCNYQAHFFTRPPLLQALVANPEVGAWLKRGSNRWNHGRDLSPVVLRAAADMILEREALREGKTIVGDKSPSSLMNGEAVRLMHNIYPDGRLVYIARDGRDTALSHRFQVFIEFPEQLNSSDRQIREDFIRDPEPYLSGQRSIFSEKGLQLAAQGWVRNMAETDTLGKTLFGEGYFSLRYEDLLAEAWEVMCRLWRFLGVDPDQASLQEAVQAGIAQNPDADYQQEKASQIASTLQKGKQGSWRQMFTTQDRRVFHEIAGDLLTTWGYSLD